MALDVLGPDDIEVDGVMSRPSNPMPYAKECSRVFAPIVFSTRKSFWKKFLGNGGTSVTSVTSVTNIVFVNKIPSHFVPFVPLQIRSRDPFPF